MTTTLPTERAVPRWWWFAAFLAAAIAAYSLRYAILGARAYIPELAESFRARPVTVLVHTLFGPLALVLGLVNLLPAMRRRERWPAHRWMGRVYLVAVLALAGAGFSLALHAAGGIVPRVGFVFLAVATLGTAVEGYVAIRGHHVRRHREWMLRSYGLIFAAVTLRIWMPILMAADGGAFLPAYRVVAWLCWVPNVVFVEWVIRRGWRPVYVVREGFQAAAASD